MLDKRWITLIVVYSRPFASEAVFWAILKDFELANSKSFKIAFEANGWQVTTGKVIQRVFNIGLYAY